MSKNNKKLTKHECIDKIIDMLKRVGLDNINFSELERETGRARQSLKKWTISILDNITPEQISREASKSFFSLNGLEQHYNELIEKTISGEYNDKTETISYRDHQQALEGKRRLEETKYKVLEAWNYKEKIADKLEVEGSVEYTVGDLVEAFKRKQTE